MKEDSRNALNEVKNIRKVSSLRNPNRPDATVMNTFGYMKTCDMFKII